MSIGEKRFAEIKDAILSGDPARVQQLGLSKSEINGNFLNPVVPRTLTQYALTMKKIDVVSQLIELGAELNIKDDTGDPLLNKLVGLSATERDLHRKRALLSLAGKMLDFGVDYNLTSRDGHTALTLAAMYRDDAFVDILESHGARGRYL